MIEIERKSKQRKMDEKDRHIRTYRQTEYNTWHQEIHMNKKLNTTNERKD